MISLKRDHTNDLDIRKKKKMFMVMIQNIFFVKKKDFFFNFEVIKHFPYIYIFLDENKYLYIFVFKIFIQCDFIKRKVWKNNLDIKVKN